MSRSDNVHAATVPRRLSLPELGRAPGAGLPIPRVLIVIALGLTTVTLGLGALILPRLSVPMVVRVEGSFEEAGVDQGQDGAPADRTAGSWAVRFSGPSHVLGLVRVGDTVAVRSLSSPPADSATLKAMIVSLAPRESATKVDAPDVVGLVQLVDPVGSAGRFDSDMPAMVEFGTHEMSAIEAFRWILR